MKIRHANLILCVVALLSILLLAFGVVFAQGETSILTPKYGGTLVIGNDSNPEGWDPQIATGIGERYLSCIYEGLVRNVRGEIVPLLAKSWDATTQDVTFHLREGVKFHNGRELVANDVVFCFERIKENDPPSMESPIFQTVDRIEALDDYTVRIYFESFYAPFLELMGKARVYPPEAVERLAEEPVGTGPFKLGEFVPNDHVTLVRNDDYWQEGLPYLNAIEFRIVPDATTALVAFKQKEVDMLTSKIPIPIADLKAMLNDPNIKMHAGGAPIWLYVCFNNLFPPTDSLLVRKAIAHCIDAELINQVVYEGIFTPAQGFLPPGHWAYNPDFTFPEYDIDEAKRLFEEAGITKLQAKITNKAFNPQYYQVVEIIGSELAKAGVELEIIPMELGRWLEVVVPEPQEPYAFWSFPNTRLSDPDHYWGTTILNIPSYSGYRNEEVQVNLRKEALEQVSRAARKEIYDRMQEIMMEELPLRVILWTEAYNAAHGYVMNFDSSGDVNWFYVDQTWLNK